MSPCAAVCSEVLRFAVCGALRRSLRIVWCFGLHSAVSGHGSPCTWIIAITLCCGLQSAVQRFGSQSAVHLSALHHLLSDYILLQKIVSAAIDSSNMQCFFTFQVENPQILSPSKKTTGVLHSTLYILQVPNSSQ